jgi:hypothetical protein
MSNTTVQADRNLNWIKGTTFTAAPVTLWLALMGTAGSKASAGTELTGSSYARAAITSSTGWSAISTVNGARQITNAADIVFPTATGNWNSGAPIPAWEIYDASTVGNRIRYGTFDTPTICLNGKIFKVLAGTLVLADL